ncbi:MAG: hypothetical protein KDA41_21045, partial [Planctomycetales bacterium]|nr:hypothetical protein [Planctomycetales bacterium]
MQSPDNASARADSSSSSLCGWGAAEIARRVAAGEISAREVVAAHIARCEAVHARLNAVCVPLFESAQESAAALDRDQALGRPLGLLHGVPVTIKECFHVAGTPSTMGLTKLQHDIQSADGPLVARWKRAGAVVLGKTNVPLLMVFHETDNPLYGRTNNPWNAERTSGGSSGGEAAIIAAGGSALGLASDLGGSIRIPAHFCGVSGLKPSSFRFTKQGVVSNLRGFDALQFQPGPLARRVEDLRLALSAMARDEADAANEFVAPAAARAEPAPRVEGMRIGVWEDDAYAPCSAAVRRVVDEAGRALAAAGAIVEPIRPLDTRAALHLCLALIGADGGKEFRRLTRGSQLNFVMRRLLALGGLPRWLRPALAAVLHMMGDGKLGELVAAAGPRSADGYRRLIAQARELSLSYLESL